eukprot:scaffold127824_cov51-Phaeocystis_antarctica.AAC.2
MGLKSSPRTLASRSSRVLTRHSVGLGDVGAAWAGRAADTRHPETWGLHDQLGVAVEYLQATRRPRYIS